MWVYACPEFDAQTMQCPAGHWVEISDAATTWTAMLPTLEQANAVGIAMFTSLIVLVAFRDLLIPSKEE
jgi:hypothetical protein